MSSLKVLQRNFLNDVMQLEHAGSSYIKDSNKLTASQRFHLYQDGYVLRLIEALGDSFTTVEKFLGSERFAAIAENYILNHPSRHYSIREYGESFPKFLATIDSLGNRSFIAELAEFEWMLGRAFDSCNAIPMQHAELESVAIDLWPELRFSFLPSFLSLSFDWNTPQLWKALTENLTLPDIKINSSPEYWVIWRPELDTLFRSVDDEEIFAMQCMQQADNFAGYCETFIRKQWDQAELKAVQYLKRWLEDRMFVGLS